MFWKQISSSPIDFLFTPKTYFSNLTKQLSNLLMVCVTLVWISSARKFPWEWKLFAVSTRPYKNVCIYIYIYTISSLRFKHQLDWKSNKPSNISLQTFVYLDSVSVSVHLLLQPLQSLQQPVDRRQVASTVLIGQFPLHWPHKLLHVIQWTLELQRLHKTHTLNVWMPHLIFQFI